MGLYTTNCYRGKVVYWYEPSRTLIQYDAFGSLTEVIVKILKTIEDGKPYVITIVNEDEDICIEDKISEYESFEQLTKEEVEELRKKLKEKYRHYEPIKFNFKRENGKKYLIIEIGSEYE